MRVSVAEMTRLYAVHQQSIQAATRELRLLLRELRPETRQRSPDIIDAELAEDPEPQLDGPNQPGSNWPQLNKPDHQKRAIPSKTLGNPAAPAKTKLFA